MFMVEQPWDTEVVNNTILKDDALGYHSYAVKLIESGGLKSVGDFSVRRTPGYPFYLSTIYTFAGISPWVVILSQIIVSAGIAYLIFSITKDWFNETIGKYVVVIFALEPHAILYSLVLVPDILYLFTTLLAIRFFLHSLEKEKYWIANLLLSGFFVAISV
jgi:4-amino-4-deoxy-L-arabinose transferase-like glycosyltransferase